MNWNGRRDRPRRGIRSEHLPQHQRRSALGGAVRLPPQSEVEVDLEFVGEEQMQRRPACAGGLQRLGVGRAIDRAEEGLIIEQADLDRVSQERIAELEPRARELTREVRSAEGAVQMAADGLLVWKEHAAG